MLKKRILAGALSTLALVPQAFGNNFNYNYLEFRTAVDPTFTGVEFSGLLMENVHFVARADSQFSGDVDLAAGVGFNGPLNQFADVFGQALFHSTTFPDEMNRDRQNAAEINIGLRLWLADQIEATTRVGRLDERSIFHAGLRFHSTEQLSLSAETRNYGLYGPQISMSVRFQY
ncbi:hypothetical protein [Vibrio intestinalis]|uniref:hypothetical protein n=1 Tax=Vibrio intestinalis TaxID=2933291 RepID=UPI003D8180C1